MGWVGLVDNVVDKLGLFYLSWVCFVQAGYGMEWIYQTALARIGTLRRGTARIKKNGKKR